MSTRVLTKSELQTIFDATGSYYAKYGIRLAEAVEEAVLRKVAALAEQPATQGEDVLAQIRAIVDEWDETGRGPGIKLNEISYILGTPPGKPTPLTDAQLVEHLHARGWPVVLSDAPMLREAAAALEGEPSDAQRYQWLRMAPICIAWPNFPRGPSLDAAIDAAILALRTKEAK